MKKYAIGLNSGTSFDGIDVALVEFKGNSIKPIFIDGLTHKYPQIVRKKLSELIYSPSKVKSLIHEISQLNILLGELFADGANKIIKKNKLKPESISFIGSHGQTIYHNPTKEKIGTKSIRSTLQIGSPQIIEERTGVRTISGFREIDIANGGEGAPLMPIFDEVYFKDKAPIAILNIGGISNISIITKKGIEFGFDIGPGNALIDLVTQKYFDQDFDKSGKIAKQGKLYIQEIEQAIKDPYFKYKSQKSTGKEYFNESFIKKYFSKIKNKKDLVSTLTFFTSRAITHAIENEILKKVKFKELVVSGGGTKNPVIMSDLEILMPGFKVSTSDKYGIPVDYKESMLFALLAYGY